MTKDKKTPAPPLDDGDEGPDDEQPDPPARKPRQGPEKGPLEKLAEVAAMVHMNPAAYQDKARVYVIGPDADGRTVSLRAQMPRSELVRADVWLAEWETCGPGVYRIDVIRDNGHMAASVGPIRVDVDLRKPRAAPPATPTPAPASPDDRLDRIERALEALIAAPKVEPVTKIGELRELVTLMREMPGAPASAASAADPGKAKELVELGAELARQAAKGEQPGFFARLATQENLDKLLATGEMGLGALKEMMRDARDHELKMAQQRAARARGEPDEVLPAGKASQDAPGSTNGTQGGGGEGGAGGAAPAAAE